MQQTEQLAEIASQLDYSSSVKMFALVSQSRWENIWPMLLHITVS